MEKHCSMPHIVAPTYTSVCIFPCSMWGREHVCLLWPQQDLSSLRGQTPSLAPSCQTFPARRDAWSGGEHTDPTNSEAWVQMPPAPHSSCTTVETSRELRGPRIPSLSNKGDVGYLLPWPNELDHIRWWLGWCLSGCMD